MEEENYTFSSSIATTPHVADPQRSPPSVLSVAPCLWVSDDNKPGYQSMRK